MVVESEGSRATLPECIELLRMMHEQVCASDSLAALCVVNVWSRSTGREPSYRSAWACTEDGLLHRSNWREESTVGLYFS